MNKTALIPIAEGSEEIELVTIVDVLRRAGVEVTVASANSGEKLQICASRGTHIVADAMLDDCANKHYDLIAVPGGLPGSEHLAKHAVLDVLLRDQAAQDKLFAGICAAPALVLATKGLLLDKAVTCHPSFQKSLEAKEVDGAARVVVDGNCITSQGPGTALDFALELVEQLCGIVKREEVGAPMVLTTTPTAYY
ncbi:4-methyl-5(b-hydroxyethyl)-thiazole monophosphate biosynthesis protein, putative [marine gamma proteobacterium HTCC2207]|jgi:4-methyl-5(b-hydroxyethyl)-thiazole monophosphate biosynthesis|uniref:4-methyl-5(B-hydroxyethyl)-thiazole monophosphate biosynthesis protein, putative n=1 Tax=gamma proteobacterium HTCC2207 TaxID=314287 RepID=Q1YVC9_9GAMM|nr:4-methyl-5(b-hydroxyethyl)-thiazole monophosphate biosynthesis protein, putative [marine gamma proteobacterium HTCC2207] [gamma proteobacterium HTCC2207]MBT5106902.1 DJ-1 family protein [Porticoccaceae bacterium]MBT6115597.1 DJ-1 family protein [Porticoccaceae bacterium]MBT6593349.1 DJ-1 family protein [Porticoccaceae bacterium]